MEDRAAVWGKMGAGMLHTIEAYRVFIISVTSFVAQLGPLPESFPEVGKTSCSEVVPWPGEL
eukprot:7879838-Pyramimonas_sp.AAC.1